MKATESERAFLHELHAIKKDPVGKRIIHFLVSAFPGDAPPAERMTKALAFLIKAIGEVPYAKGFVASNGDIFVCYSHCMVPKVMAACVRVQEFFGAGAVPMVRNPYGEFAFYKIVDAVRELDKVFAAFREIMSENQPELKKTFKNQVTPEHVAQLRDRLKRDDIRQCIFNQPVYNVVNNVPSIEFLKFFCSLEKLEDAYFPEVSLSGHPWLFLALAEELDRAVMSVVVSEIAEYRHKGFSINLTLRSMLSNEFSDFMENIPSRLSGRIVIEVNKTDVIQHLVMMKDIAALREDGGFRLCISGVDFHDFDVLDLNVVRPDYIRVDWRNSLLATDAEKIERWCRRIKSQGDSTFIMARCDTTKAIKFAKALGIELIQGRLADRLFRDGLEM